MSIRNLVFNQFGTIDCELNHPTLGWIPFTATPDDPEQFGKDLYLKAITGVFGSITPYVPPVVSIAELKADKLTTINAEKNRVRDGGFKVDEVLFDSDPSARISYNELSLLFSTDATATITNYKASKDVWVTMDATLYARVMAAGREHLQAIFDWYRAKEEAVVACGTIEDLNLIGEVYE